MTENASHDAPRTAARRSGAAPLFPAAQLHIPVRRSYDELAASYDTRWRHYIEATSALAVEALPPEAAGRALNIACGTGELERQLRRHRPKLRLAGADLSVNMLRRAASKGLAADWLAAVATHLPLADGSFDHVLCVNAFHYFRLPGESLAEMRRVLQPGGTLTLVDWCDDFWSCKLCSLWLRWTDPAFYRTYSLVDCKSLVEQAGFRVISSKKRRVGWLWGLMQLVCRN